MRARGVAIGDTHDVLMIRVRAAGPFNGEPDTRGEARSREELAVDARVLAPSIRPLWEVWQLHAQHRGLQSIQAEVAAYLVVVILRVRSMAAQQPHPPCESFVAGGHEAGVAERAEVLRRKNEKHPMVPTAPAGRPSSVAPRACAASSMM